MRYKGSSFKNTGSYLLSHTIPRAVPLFTRPIATVDGHDILFLRLYVFIHLRSQERDKDGRVVCCTYEVPLCVVFIME